MDYRERYEKLVNSDWFKEIYHNKSLGDCPVEIPELRESEDEKVKKALLHLVKSQKELHFGIAEYDGVNWCDIVDWLEKQKEHHHTEWSDEDEKMFNRVIESMIDYQAIAIDCGRSQIEKNAEEEIKWLKSIKPQLHWKPSEENIKDLEWCADLVKEKMGVGFHRLQVFIDELKTLRDYE